jgi:hypothetical protein
MAGKRMRMKMEEYLEGLGGLGERRVGGILIYGVWFGLVWDFEGKGVVVVFIFSLLLCLYFRCCCVGAFIVV